MSYSGPDRRVHTAFLTRNREYHVRDGFCVAVRDRKSHAWISNHEAIGMTLESRQEVGRYLGKQLLFLSDFAKVQTTSVEGIHRPERSIVDVYGLLWAICPG